jgi:hypothetical protein
VKSLATQGTRGGRRSVAAVGGPDDVAGRLGLVSAMVERGEQLARGKNAADRVGGNAREVVAAHGDSRAVLVDGDTVPGTAVGPARPVPPLTSATAVRASTGVLLGVGGADVHQDLAAARVITEDLHRPAA